MSLTKEEILENNHISTQEIELDIKDTENEINCFNEELSVLKKNPIRNKTKIYMLEGRVIKRKKFVNNLKSIIEYRQKNNNE